MQCERMQELLGAYIDGELSADERGAMADHLGSCKACGDVLADYQRIGRAFKREGRLAAPPGLANRIGLALDRITDTPTLAIRDSLRARRFDFSLRTLDARGMSRRAAALAIACGSGALAGWWSADAGRRAGGLASDVLNAHMRSLLQESPVQIASNDSHNVQPWFAGRADFAPAVRDLGEQGFVLVGGRLDYISDRRVGAVVYKRRLHVVNVFMWPADVAESAPSAATRNGYNLVSWSRHGFSYWAVSDLNAQELRTLSDLL